MVVDYILTRLDENGPGTDFKKLLGEQAFYVTGINILRGPVSILNTFDTHNGFALIIADKRNRRTRIDFELEPHTIHIHSWIRNGDQLYIVTRTAH